MDGVAQARWRAAEDRLYPLAMSDPAGYRQGLAAVQAAVEELRRTAHTVEDLVAVESDPASLLGRSSGPVHAELVVRAACAVRYRELTAERERARRAGLLDDARAAGRPWVVLAGPDRIEELVGLQFNTTATVAVHLASGRALTAAVDPYSGGEPYRLQEFGSDGDERRAAVFDAPGAWVAEHDRWRAEIESS